MKYHKRGNRFVQINRIGIWHGYENCLYRETFENETEAIQWLNQPTKK